MTYEEAEQTIKETIKGIDLYNLKGFDFYYDKFWSGQYEEEIRLDTKEEQYLFFQGDINFNIDPDGLVCDVKVESFETFEQFDKYGETIQKFN